MLNKVLPVDNHQLPLINDIFNSMSCAVIFSTLGLKSAFNQFSVNKDDQIKTTFTAPNNLQYTVAVKIGRMFSYFAYTRCGLPHFLVYSNVAYTIRKSKLWVTLW
jgi:hypothetical protein